MHQGHVKFRTRLWLVLPVLVAVLLEVVSLSGPNVCIVKQKYNITKRVKYRAPMSVRTYVWCFSMPPRCSNWTTEMRDLTKLQTEEKTAEVAVCCQGYKMKDGSCVPICPNGKTGPGCSEDCLSNKWGPNCVNDCEPCDHGTCSPLDGTCRCEDGWQGESCELSMPTTTPATVSKLTKKPTTKIPARINTTPATAIVKFSTETPSAVSQRTTAGTMGYTTKTSTTPPLNATTERMSEEFSRNTPVATTGMSATKKLTNSAIETLTKIASTTYKTVDFEDTIIENTTQRTEIQTTNATSNEIYTTESSINKGSSINANQNINRQMENRQRPTTSVTTESTTDITVITTKIMIENSTATLRLNATTEMGVIDITSEEQKTLQTTTESIKMTTKSQSVFRTETNNDLSSNSTSLNNITNTATTKILSELPKKTESTTRLTTTNFKPKEIWIKPAQKGDAFESKKTIYDVSRHRIAANNDNPNTTPKTIIVSIIPTSVSYVTFKRIALTTVTYLTQKQNATRSQHTTEGFTKPIPVQITVKPITKTDNFSFTTPQITNRLKSTPVPAKRLTDNKTNRMIEVTSSLNEHTTEKIASSTKTANKTASNNSTKGNEKSNFIHIVTTDNPVDEEIFHILTEPEHITAVMGDKEMGRSSVDLTSVVSIAVGIMIVIITVAVVIVMIERCKRPRYDEVRKTDDRMQDIPHNDDAPPPYVRSIFHSPLPELPSTGLSCHYQPISTLDRNLKQFMRPVVVQSISPIMLENFRDILECHYDHLPRRSHNLSIDGRCSLAPSMTCCTELRTHCMTDETIIESLKREARLDIIDNTTSEPLYAEIPCWRPPSEHAVEILNMNGEAVTEL
ncbi:mucin-17-like isoform X1 [Bombyx mandarina]|uniref:Mucin-17-like isoform X1 n=1 Tax=Bombyx mandarina TaxID=7092 RepID=A0A6J2JW44_BOMMA|nr:mucin-17-like isoform X1 [Bombyx mandarina]XP_028033112.1 mucin-17-like isoform X1 [Bombyx mandarina]XP_028033113.1 mucin-17-like isoform X1 [Bombyx mandarina]XP_028033114.1 mucin-17-like isoform X1 [Bombyx mandarina]